VSRRLALALASLALLGCRAAATLGPGGMPRAAADQLETCWQRAADPDGCFVIVVDDHRTDLVVSGISVQVDDRPVEVVTGSDDRAFLTPLGPGRHGFEIVLNTRGGTRKPSGHGRVARGAWSIGKVDMLPGDRQVAVLHVADLSANWRRRHELEVRPLPPPPSRAPAPPAAGAGVDTRGAWLERAREAARLDMRALRLELARAHARQDAARVACVEPRHDEAMTLVTTLAAGLAGSARSRHPGERQAGRAARRGRRLPPARSGSVARAAIGGPGRLARALIGAAD
jgi:hypothetical protein